MGKQYVDICENEKYMVDTDKEKFWHIKMVNIGKLIIVIIIFDLIYCISRLKLSKLIRSSTYKLRCHSLKYTSLISKIYQALPKAWGRVDKFSLRGKEE